MAAISSFPNQNNPFSGAVFPISQSGVTFAPTLDSLYKGFKARDLSNRDISGDFRVSGDLLTTGRFTVSGFASLANVQITGNVNFRSNLLISGNQTITGNIVSHNIITAQNNIISSGSINCSGTLVALSGVDFARTLNVTGKGTFGHDFSSYGYTELAISGRPTIIYGTNQVRSNETVWGTETIGGATTISGALRTSGAVTIDNTVNIYNAIYLRGDVQIGGNTATSGSLTTSGNFFVSGNSQLGDNVSDLTNIAGDIIARGYSSFTGGLSAGANSRISGTLVVTGNLSANNGVFGNDLRSSGNTYLGSVSTNNVLVTGSIFSTNNLGTNANLNVRQNSTLSGNLTLSGSIISPSIKYVTFDGVTKASSVANVRVSGNSTVHFHLSTGHGIYTGDYISIISVLSDGSPLTNAQKAAHSGIWLVTGTGVGKVVYSGDPTVTGHCTAVVDYVMKSRQGVSGIERPSVTAGDYRIVFSTPFANSQYVTQICCNYPTIPFVHWDDRRNANNKRVICNTAGVGFEDVKEFNFRAEGGVQTP